MRENVIWLLGGSVAVMVVGYVLTNSILFNLCLHEEYACRDFYNKAGDPLLYGAGALAIVFLLLLIFPHAFNAWKKFALWFLPPAIDIFATYKGPSGGFMDPTPQPEKIYLWLSVFYICISAFIIAISFIRKRFGKSTVKEVPSKKQEIVFWTLWAIYVAIIIGAHLFD